MLKKLPLRILIAIAVAMVVVVAGLTALFVLNIFTVEDGPIEVGSLVRFGPYEWRVLDMQDGRALLITEYIIALRPYHEIQEEVTWEHSDIRRWLRDDFLSSLNRSRIVRTMVVNHDNPWHGTDGGNDTEDYVFLLSLEELLYYFGVSGQVSGDNRDNRLASVYDISVIERANVQWGWEYSEQEIQNKLLDRWVSSRRQGWRSRTLSWWLRSPGAEWDTNAAVFTGWGEVSVGGNNIDDNSKGVRPALWVRLEE